MSKRASRQEWADKWQEHREKGDKKSRNRVLECESRLSRRDLRRVTTRKLADMERDTKARRDLPRGVEVLKPWHRKEGD